MKIKFLRYIKKYLDYKFMDGKVILRRKVDGKIWWFDSIGQVISHCARETEFEGQYYKWRQRKSRIANAKIWNGV